MPHTPVWFVEVVSGDEQIRKVRQEWDYRTAMIVRLLELSERRRYLQRLIMVVGVSAFLLLALSAGLIKVYRKVNLNRLEDLSGERTRFHIDRPKVGIASSQSYNECLSAQSACNRTCSRIRSDLMEQNGCIARCWEGFNRCVGTQQ